MKKEDIILQQKKEIELLKQKIEILITEAAEREKTLNNLIKERLESELLAREVTQNAVLREKELQTEVSTWQKVVDELAHSINTDVFAALSNLNEIVEDINIKKAKNNIKRIRDITNLILWDLNKSRLPASKNLIELDIFQLISSEIESIKDGIDSLRLSVREHKKKLIELNIPIKAKNKCIVQIDDNIAAGLELIIKDILRNAFQNTDEENPQISVEMFSQDEIIYLIIKNNRLISEMELRWFNEGIDDNNIPMSKSAKVGLRLVKRWFINLGIKGEFLIDLGANQTSISLKIPKVIKYEKI